MGIRVAFLVVGTLLFGPGSGFYIGVGMGPGPRDGLMTALAARGYSVRVVRTAIEVSVLVPATPPGVPVPYPNEGTLGRKSGEGQKDFLKITMKEIFMSG